MFVIQNTQNREGRALQAKLDAQSPVLEQIAVRLDIDHGAMVTELVGVEDAPEQTIKHQRNVRRAVSRSRRPD